MRFEQMHHVTAIAGDAQQNGAIALYSIERDLRNAGMGFNDTPLADIVSAGKHSYSEKPFVLTVEEGLALKKAADERGLKVGSAPDTFLGGAHQQAREITAPFRGTLTDEKSGGLVRGRLRVRRR